MSWLRVSSEETTLRKIYGVEGFRFLRFMNITSGTYQGEKLVMCLKPVVAAVHKGSMGNLTAKISLEKKTNLPVIIVLSTPLRSPFPISTSISLQETNIRQLRAEFWSKVRSLFVSKTYFVKINDTIILSRSFSSFISPSWSWMMNGWSVMDASMS